MKKLVFDKQEVVHIDSVTAANTILGYHKGNPAVTIFYDRGMWHYYGQINHKPISGDNWSELGDVISTFIQREKISEFYIV